MKWEEDLPRTDERERLTAKGAAILFVVLAIAITFIVRLAPPNLTITAYDTATRQMTERP